MRKWIENEEMERNEEIDREWRENEEMEKE